MGLAEEETVSKDAREGQRLDTKEVEAEGRAGVEALGTTFGLRCINTSVSCPMVTAA